VFAIHIFDVPDQLVDTDRITTSESTLDLLSSDHPGARVIAVKEIHIEATLVDVVDLH
jgi:hypothetical protein